MSAYKIYPIIVTYYSELTNCKTYRSLLARQKDLSFLIYDNSPHQINRKYESSRINYYGDGVNKGVSAAYNYGCKIAEQKGFEYVLLLDEDTLFDNDFLEELCSAIDNNIDIDIFAPSIYYQGEKPFSPSHCSLLKTRGVSLVANNRYSLNKYVPVNSGTCIRVSTFMKIGGYNEKIKLDFADFDFFFRIAPLSSFFMLIDSKAYQNFSNDEQDVNKLEKRYLIYLDGALATPSKHRFILQVLRHSLALTIRTKSLSFTKIFLKKYLFKF